MKVLVTGLPRHRSSLIVRTISEKFKISAPENVWGETHKFGENIHTWLTKDNCVFKAWGTFNDDFEEQLENFDGTIIVTYSEDVSLFIAKLITAHLTRNYSIGLHRIEPIPFNDDLVIEIEKLRPTIHTFRKSLDTIFLNKNIILKCIFVKEASVFAHIQSSANIQLIPVMQELCATWHHRPIQTYITHDTVEKFYEYVHSSFGRHIC